MLNPLVRTICAAVQQRRAVRSLRDAAACSIGFAIAMVSHSSTTQAQTAGAADSGAVNIRWGVKIPMRDGVLLHATVYRPGAERGRIPVIVAATPYTTDHLHARGSYFARHGFAFVAVDVRGRGNSGGLFALHGPAPEDLYDIIEWSAAQPWSTGNVGMWGGSALGLAQWNGVRARPPHLRTIAPAAAAHWGADFPSRNGVIAKSALLGLAEVAGRTWNREIAGDAGYRRWKIREHHYQHLPLAVLDSVLGFDLPAWKQLVSHPALDSVSSRWVPSQADYAGIAIPILSITGYWDGDQAGTLEYYRRHQLHGTPTGRVNHFLLIGPWNHRETRTGTSGALRDSLVFDLDELHRQWYDWTLRGGAKPALLRAPVTYFDTTWRRWAYASSLDEIVASRVRFYLGSRRGEATSAERPGTLVSRAPGFGGPDEYINDPLDHRPATQSDISADLFGNVRNGVLYVTEPFADDREIFGFWKLVVHMSIDVPDTDFYVRLEALLPSGETEALDEAILRARYRESLTHPTLVRAGQVVRYTIKDSQLDPIHIPKGARLRLMISAPNHPSYEKNFNGGGLVAFESARDARTARIRVYHDARWQSYLEIPLRGPRR